MKIFVFADNLLGFDVLKFLKKKNENIVGIAVHTKKYQNNNIKILNLIKKTKIFKFGRTISKKQLAKIKTLEPDVILVVYWRFLLSKEIIKIAKFGAINFHMGYLPFNRGANPNVWPLIENTPAGCTIHKINEKIDSGFLIAQKKVNHYITDTAKTLYLRILKNFQILLKEEWDKIKKKKFKGKKMNIKKGTIHFRKQFKSLSRINLSKKFYPLELFNNIRAKMFEPNESSYFVYKNKKYLVEIKIKKK